MLDGGTLAVGNAVRPAPACTLFGELAQIAGRRLAWRHQLVGILIPQFIKRETALLCNRHGLLEKLARIKPREPRRLTQIAFTVGIQMPAGFCDRHVEADRGERVLQPAARAHVHVDIAAREESQAELVTDTFECDAALVVSPIAEQDRKSTRL